MDRIKMNYNWKLSEANFTKDKGKVFSCFACGGGSTMGYKLAGFDVIGHNDIDPKMVEVYKENHKPKFSYLESITTFAKRKDLPKELYELDILDGSPPCSSFSMAGNREKDWGKEKVFREGQELQVLDTLFFDFIDLANELRPKVVVAENVKGLLMGEAKQYVIKIYEAFDKAGYTCQHFLLNASKMGVPQRRERVFFVAIRDDIEGQPLKLAAKHRWINAGEACQDLQTLTNEEVKDTKSTGIDAKAWSYTEEGGCYADYFKKYEGRNNAFSHQKISSKKPSCTLTATFDNFTHWGECRKLTYREWKRLGSFPDDYQAKSDKIGKYMIGMSVPPKMTEQVARAVIDQWLLPKEE